MYLVGVYFAHAVIAANIEILKKNHDARDYLHVAVDLRQYKSDFCHVLGLCIEGKSWRDTVPKLKWNSVYIAGRPSLSPPTNA